MTNRAKCKLNESFCFLFRGTVKKIGGLFYSKPSYDIKNKQKKCNSVAIPLRVKIYPFASPPGIFYLAIHSIGNLLASYMQKTCDVAEMAILAKKNCGKSA